MVTLKGNQTSKNAKWIPAFLHFGGFDVLNGFFSLKINTFNISCTLPTDQTIHNWILSKVCCDGFTRGIRNACNNQHNILLWIAIWTMLITESHAVSQLFLELSFVIAFYYESLKISYSVYLEPAMLLSLLGCSFFCCCCFSCFWFFFDILHDFKRKNWMIKLM